MSSSGSISREDITLYLVLQYGIDNLANTLNSVNKLASQIVVVDGTESPGQTSRFLVSEYDGKYIQHYDEDDSVLLNHGLDNVQTDWALFMKPEEVIHIDDVEQAIGRVSDSGVDALEMPVIRLSEPSNYHFEIRLIRRAANFHWPANLKPMLWDGVLDATLESDAKPNVALWSNMAIVSLGEPKLNAAQLESRLAYYRRKLGRTPDSAAGWYQIAQIAQHLENWDEHHKSVEAGFNCMVGDVKSTLKDTESLNGLTGMFCEELVRAKFFSAKTTESLWQILKSTHCDGRFSVPLGHLLIAQNRIADAKFAQYEALRNFVDYRRYYLPLKECLFYPALMLLELEAGDSDTALINSLKNIQELISQNSGLFPPLFAFISERNQKLFIHINQLLKGSSSRNK